jgi:hypothetical protein
MKKTILLIIILFSFAKNSVAQKEVRDGIFLYGKLQNTIHGNILVAYKIEDPESEAIILDRLEETKLPTVSYHDFFLPGVKYETREIDSFLDEKKIETIICITKQEVNSHTEINMSSMYVDLLKTNFTFGSSGKILDNLALSLEIYNKKDGFKRPVAILHATNDKNLDFQTSLTRIIKEILRTLEDEAAYGGEKKAESGIDGMKDYINGRKSR